MRYFYKLASGIAVLPLMAAIARNPSWWNSDKTRTSIPNGPHGAADDILLRFGNANITDTECWDRELMGKLPGARDTVLNIMRMVSGSRLGRVMITRLAPGHKILPHCDEGEYAKYYTRYHLVLQGFPGSLFICGDETVQMMTGDLWWFDAASEHSVVNNSQDDRVHMLIDVRVDQ